MLNEPVLAAGTALTTGQLVVLDGPNYPGMPVYVVQSNTTAGALTSGITGKPLDPAMRSSWTVSRPLPRADAVRATRYF